MPDNTQEPDILPFVAPCRRLTVGAPWRWLKLGMKDVRRAPGASLSYGIVMALLLMSLVLAAAKYGSAWIMLSLLCGLVFIAPLACIGTYAISAQIERDIPVSLKRSLRACLKRYIGTELVFTLVILVVFLVWARASSMTSIFLPSTGEYQLMDMSSYLAILSLISLVFLGIIFAASVFSLPMIMHRDVDAITAIVTSINAVLRNKLTMLIWATLIGLLVLVGMLTAGFALVFLLPSIGHAVWHGYLETIDAESFPRHSTGITSTKRKFRDIS